MRATIAGVFNGVRPPVSMSVVDGYIHAGGLLLGHELLREHEVSRKL